MKQIKFSYEGKEYTLEYTKNTVRQMERRGFVVEELAAKPMTNFLDLFAGAFLSKHPQVKREKIEEIYDSLKGRKKLISALTEMYTETIEYLIDECDEGNENWTPNFEVSET